MVPSTGLLVALFALARLTPSCDAGILSLTVDRDVHDLRIHSVTQSIRQQLPKNGSASLTH